MLHMLHQWFYIFSKTVKSIIAGNWRSWLDVQMLKKLQPRITHPYDRLQTLVLSLYTVSSPTSYVTHMLDCFIIRFVNSAIWLISSRTEEFLPSQSQKSQRSLTLLKSKDGLNYHQPAITHVPTGVSHINMTG